MLWKLADNVKYEDDCEVSVEGGFCDERKVHVTFFSPLNLGFMVRKKKKYNTLVSA